MSDYHIFNPVLGNPGPVTRTDSTPQFPIGIECDAFDRSAATSGGGAAGRFVYCRGSDVGTIGAFVHIQNGSAVMLASANAQSNFPIGVAAGLLSATNAYGWVQVQGRVDYARGTNTGNTAGVPRYIGATAGILLSNAVAGQRVIGVVVPANQTSTAAVSASGVYDLFRPFILGTFNSASATNATNGY